MEMFDSIREGLGGPVGPAGMAGPPGTDGPELVGRRIALRAIRRTDYDLLYALELSQDLGYRWRHRGTTPSPERFMQTLWDGVLVQHLAIDKRTNEPVGLMAIYNPDFRNRLAHFAVTLLPQYHRLGWPLEGVELFLCYTFQVFDLRKLYAETFDFNYTAFRSGITSIFHEEARLKNHEFYDGHYWDKVLLAVYRDEWQTRRDELVTNSNRLVASQSFDEFTHILSEVLAIDYSAITPEARLTEDLGLDSFGLFVVVAYLDEMNLSIPEQSLATALTVGDLYELSTTQAIIK